MKTTSRLCGAALAAALVLGTAGAANAQGRHGHRDNTGVVAGALLGGLVIGGLIANSNQPAYAYPPPPPAPVYVTPAPTYVVPAPVYAGPSPHVDWCYRNTPGYNPNDNTYQGYYAGERIVCRSPYAG